MSFEPGSDFDDFDKDDEEETRTPETSPATISFRNNLPLIGENIVYGVTPVFNKSGKVVDVVFGFLPEQSSRLARDNEALYEIALKTFIDLYDDIFGDDPESPDFSEYDGWRHHGEWHDDNFVSHNYREERSSKYSTGYEVRVTVVDEEPELLWLKDVLQIMVELNKDKDFENALASETRKPQPIPATVSYIDGYRQEVYGIVPEIEDGKVIGAKVAFVPEQSKWVIKSNPSLLEAAERTFREVYELEFLPNDHTPFFGEENVWHGHSEFKEHHVLSYGYQDRSYGERRKGWVRAQPFEKITVITMKPELGVLQRSLEIIYGNVLKKGRTAKA